MPATEPQKKYLRNRYKRYRLQGLCGSCGKQSRPNRSSCAACCSFQKTWRRNMTSETKQRYACVTKRWADSRREQLRQKGRDKNAALKSEVVRHYGDKCVCCGESNIVFLTIDHIFGGGLAHRRQLGKGKAISSTGFYHWLKKTQFPAGFQVMCFNCNCAKRAGDVCPHKKEEC